MKIITTGDWHLGNMFHGNDRSREHEHFLNWLINRIEEEQPDALLIAGDVYDNGNPSATAQSLYYGFLAEATLVCPDIQIIVIAGNHDSAYRLEAPRVLLSRHKVEVRGAVHRHWITDDDEGFWEIDYDDLMIPVEGKSGDKIVVLAVPYLRNDVVQNESYSAGVKKILQELTLRAREKYPDVPLVMMAHLYASGADIAKKDASEKIVIGGQEEVNMSGWEDHPDYFTCGHIHKRQHIFNTDWARYSGSVLPMSFAEIDYHHGVDMITFTPDAKPEIKFLEYIPQHKLKILPENDEPLKFAKLKKIIEKELPDRLPDGKLNQDDFLYLVLKIVQENVNNDLIKELEALLSKKNVVVCKIQKIVPTIDISTITSNEKLQSIDDILDRDPLDTLKEAFATKFSREMTENQVNLLKSMLDSLTEEL